ncbi:MAG: hypothetical protein QXJ06_00140 [Candidatus Aenigmatarchaeota archaeon]
MKVLLVELVLLLFLLNFSLVFAQTQSHPLSQLYPIDTDLIMNNYNITNVKYLGVGTSQPTKTLDVIGDLQVSNTIFGNTIKIGGGFESNGLTIDSNGNILTHGNLTYSGYTYIIDTLRFNGTIEGPYGIKGGFVYPGVCNTDIDCLQANYYLFTNGSIINSSTDFAAPVFYESGSSLSNKYVSRNDWTSIDNYPPACPNGQFVTGLGDTLSCASPSSGSGSGWTMSENYLYNATTGVKVGIGVPEPSAKLDVAGNINATSFYDRDDSQYYVDPSGLSLLNNLQIVSGTLTGANNEQINIGATDNIISFISGGQERMRIHSNGFVGINTQSPSSELDISGQLSIIGKGSNPTFYLWDSSSATSGSMYGLQFIVYGNPTATSSINLRGIEGSARTQSGNSQTFTGSVIGAQISGQHLGSGNVNQLGAIWAYPYVNSAGTVSEASGIYIDYYLSGGGTITNLYGLRISSGTITGTITNRYAIYADDANAKSYFAGSFGIGTKNPVKKLDVVGDFNVTGDVYLGGDKIRDSNSNSRIEFSSGSVIIYIG